MEKRQDFGVMQVENRIASFLDAFGVKTLLQRCGIRKRHGAHPFDLLTKIFQLPFTRQSFYHDVINCKTKGMKKDTIYAILKDYSHNWRRFLLGFVSKVIVILFQPLTSDLREKVFIIDTSLYVRSRSKCTELLSWVHDHVLNRSFKGFNLLALGWSDGNSFLPLDFVLMAASDPTKLINGINPTIPKNSNGYKRRAEALKKATENVIPMITRALQSGMTAHYVLMDSWFAFPNLIAAIHALSPQFDVICRLKDLLWIRYQYKGRSLRLSELYLAVKKRRGRAIIKASILVKLQSGLRVRIIFCKAENKKGWIAILSTNTKIPDNEIIRIYGKRWDVEVFFKVIKSHLRLVKEIQVKSYDALIAHTTIVFLRYIMLACRQRESIDDRTIDGMFRQCIKELEDITFLEAVNRLLALVVDRIRKNFEYTENLIDRLIDELIKATEDLFLKPEIINSES